MWERIRTLTTICIQPYSKITLKPKDILPWDKKKRMQAERISKKEATERFEKLLRRIVI